jgi:hypothetical protein
MSRLSVSRKKQFCNYELKFNPNSTSTTWSQIFKVDVTYPWNTHCIVYLKKKKKSMLSLILWWQRVHIKLFLVCVSIHLICWNTFTAFRWSLNTWECWLGCQNSFHNILPVVSALSDLMPGEESELEHVKFFLWSWMINLEMLSNLATAQQTNDFWRNVQISLAGNIVQMHIFASDWVCQGIYLANEYRVISAPLCMPKLLCQPLNAQFDVSCVTINLNLRGIIVRPYIVVCIDKSCIKIFITVWASASWGRQARMAPWPCYSLSFCLAYIEVSYSSCEVLIFGLIFKWAPCTKGFVIVFKSLRDSSSTNFV